MKGVLCLFTFSLAVLYCTFSFASLDLNPMCWQEGVRYGFVTMVCLALLLSFGAYRHAVDPRVIELEQLRILLNKQSNN